MVERLHVQLSPLNHQPPHASGKNKMRHERHRHAPKQLGCQRTGQPVPEGVSATVRCILESLALKYRYVIESIETILARRLSPIVVLGGGARNSLLNQFTADALQRTVIGGPVEATALGNLVVQMIGHGELADLQEARALIRASTPLATYTPGDCADWDAAYSRLRQLMEQSK